MSQNPKNFWLMVGALLGGLSVAMGAFGAHALEDVLTPHYREVYGTASRYAMIHAVLLSGLSLCRTPTPKYIMWFFTLGICIFSGTLWLLSITQIKWLGAITPIGGLLLLLGWGGLFWWGKNGCA